MSKTKIDKIIRKAEHSCEQAGARLTAKRKNVLSSLLRASMPLSAYEIAEHYKADFDDAIPVMSIYRMLDFLSQENLVHKLDSTNKYVACSHIACDHAHEIPQFLICDTCHNVREIGVKKDIIEALRDSVASAGFQLGSPQLELHGLCENCR
ncbi:Fur family transcriptional regulator [Methylophaga sp. OBS4]|uniref:Fur family transcriptional regulator n=1 Tax=Methylophaga sp. OBS4 TaxID=2991935 RepID=UPI002251BE83|nr:transcriptional repressor [Methylophaga sp. OBS4]MCX4186971.1 transcriptional repressor [Methylophaga sp. OBS4]